MPNAVRGESEIHVAGVGAVTLCVTLATMACLEDHFEVNSLEEAVAMIGQQASSTNLATLLHALTLGGPREYSVEEIRKWPISPAEITAAMNRINKANEDAAGNVSASAPPVENRATRRAAPRAK